VNVTMKVTALMLLTLGVAGLLVGWSFPTYRADLLAAEKACAPERVMSVQTRYWPLGFTRTVVECMDLRRIAIPSGDAIVERLSSAYPNCTTRRKVWSGDIVTECPHPAAIGTAP
jgi:hypothetical protein